MKWTLAQKVQDMGRRVQGVGKVAQAYVQEQGQ